MAKMNVYSNLEDTRTGFPVITVGSELLDDVLDYEIRHEDAPTQFGGIGPPIGYTVAIIKVKVNLGGPNGR